jgi:hypothetical protein
MHKTINLANFGCHGSVNSGDLTAYALGHHYSISSNIIAKRIAWLFKMFYLIIL